MILFPNAKINIGLNIVAKRTDGYHDIETIMYPIGWSDILEIIPSNNTSLSITGRTIACDIEKNLVMKAYRLMAQIYNIPEVEIHLHKIIPDGAGLGGGSSDAAHTLIALNALYNLNLSEDELANIAAKLGADCPFFIYNKPMIATGIGTDFSPINIDLKDYYILVVKPQVSVPTSVAYSNVTPMVPKYKLGELVNKPIDYWMNDIKNDFEESIFKSFPIIDNIKKQIYNMGAIYVSMSGSGSSVYGIFNRDILAENLLEKFPNCDIYINNKI